MPELPLLTRARALSFISTRDSGEIYTVEADGTGEARLTGAIPTASAWPGRRTVRPCSPAIRAFIACAREEAECNGSGRATRPAGRRTGRRSPSAGEEDEATAQRPFVVYGLGSTKTLDRRAGELRTARTRRSLPQRLRPHHAGRRRGAGAARGRARSIPLRLADDELRPRCPGAPAGSTRRAAHSAERTRTR
jgi:hypothetical protein